MQSRPRALAASVLVLAATTTAAVTGGVADSSGSSSAVAADRGVARHGSPAFDIGLWGDLPYTPEQRVMGCRT